MRSKHTVCTSQINEALLTGCGIWTKCWSYWAAKVQLARKILETMLTCQSSAVPRGKAARKEWTVDRTYLMLMNLTRRMCVLVLFFFDQLLETSYWTCKIRLLGRGLRFQVLIQTASHVVVFSGFHHVIMYPKTPHQRLSACVLVS